MSKKPRSDEGTKRRRVWHPTPSSLRRSVASSLPRPAFTLVEMLLATALAALLMGGVLAVSANLSRDRLRMEAHTVVEHGPGVSALLRHDLINAAAILNAGANDQIELLGYGGINSTDLRPDGRLVRVLYRLDRRGRGPGTLIREQAYLDDPVRVDRWTEIVATNVKRISLGALSLDADPLRLGEDVEVRLRNLTAGRESPPPRRVPSRLRLRIEYTNAVDDRELVLR